MRLLCVLIFSFDLLAVDIPHLGVISPSRALVLDARSQRVGFRHFLVEVRPDAAPTNIVTLAVTNEMLTVTNLIQVPSGPGTIGVRSVYWDSESEIAIYRYDLRRAAPPRPLVTVTHVGGAPEVEKSLTNEIRRVRERFMMPVPPMIPPRDTPKATAQPRRPLPAAEKRSYAEHLDWMADRAAQGLRRSE